MADNTQLDTFLAAGTPPEGAEAPAAPPAPEHTPEASEAAPEAAAKPPEPEEDVAPHSGSDNRTVPFSALEKVRNDWKSKYAAEQARAELLAKQLEEAKKPPPPQVSQPQPMPPLAPIDPSQDPQGFTIRLQQVLLNERLNNSEMMLREKLGPEKVDEYVAEFKELAQRDQTLFGKLYQQTNPYSWMHREVERQRVLRDVGDDPSAYRSKIEAEARARWEAEAAAKAPPPPVSPAAGLQPSLATARSVAGRSASTWSGEPSLEDVLSPVQNRKRPNGNGSIRY
jgi:hypothetical protein